MTKLNLNARGPARRPRKKNPWTLQVKTDSREQIVRLGIFLAKAFNPAFLHNVEDPPIVVVNGTGGGGKSMIIEAMMKTLLDQTDPLDMLAPDARKEMFIEQYGAEALSSYCYAAGTQDGIPVLYGFDRRNEWHKKDLVGEFANAVKEVRPKPAGGAIFTSNNIIRKDTGHWLRIDIRDPQGYGSGWNRTNIISVRSNKLKTDPKFSLYWNRLNDAVRNRDFSLLSAPVGRRLSVKAPVPKP